MEKNNVYTEEIIKSQELQFRERVYRMEAVPLVEHLVEHLPESRQVAHTVTENRLRLL